MRAQWTRPYPVSRLGRPNQVADLAPAVLRNGYMASQVIRVDGGIYPDRAKRSQQEEEEEEELPQMTHDDWLSRNRGSVPGWAKERGSHPAAFRQGTARHDIHAISDSGRGFLLPGAAALGSGGPTSSAQLGTFGEAFPRKRLSGQTSTGI